MISWIFSPAGEQDSIIAGIAIATILVVIALIAFVFWLDDRRDAHKAEHARPRTFHAAAPGPGSRKTALAPAINLPGRACASPRDAAAGEPVPAMPEGPVPYYAAVAWQAAGVNATQRNWTPHGIEATTSWDTPLMRGLQDLLQAESVDTWLDKNFAGIIANARKELAS